jgi:hypothetical protein
MLCLTGERARIEDETRSFKAREGIEWQVSHDQFHEIAAPM